MVRFSCKKGLNRLKFNISCFTSAELIRTLLERDGWVVETEEVRRVG